MGTNQSPSLHSNGSAGHSNSTPQSKHVTNTNHSTDKKFNVFEFQSILRGGGVYIPSDMIVSVFVQAYSKREKAQRDIDNSTIRGANNEDPALCLFTIGEIYQEISEMAVSEKNIPFKAFVGVAMDYPSVFNFLAGWFLFVGLFPINATVYSITTGLLMPVFYLTAGGQTVIGKPLRDMKEITMVKGNAIAFKMSVRTKASEYEKEKQNNRTSVFGGKHSLIRALPSSFVEEMQYIEEVIFDSGRSSCLTKTELEMLLLRELGTSYNSQTLEYVLSIASQTRVSMHKAKVSHIRYCPFKNHLTSFHLTQQIVFHIKPGGVSSLYCI